MIYIQKHFCLLLSIMFGLFSLHYYY